MSSPHVSRVALEVALFRSPKPGDVSNGRLRVRVPADGRGRDSIVLVLISCRAGPLLTPFRTCFVDLEAQLKGGTEDETRYPGPIVDPLSSVPSKSATRAYLTVIIGEDGHRRQLMPLREQPYLYTCYSQSFTGPPLPPPLVPLPRSFLPVLSSNPPLTSPLVADQALSKRPDVPSSSPSILPIVSANKSHDHKAAFIRSSSSYSDINKGTTHIDIPSTFLQQYIRMYVSHLSQFFWSTELDF